MDYIIIVKIGRRRIRAVKPSAVMDVLDRLDGYISNQRKKATWEQRKFIVSFLFWTGLRASELLLVKRRDIDIVSKVLNAPTLKQRGSLVYTPISLYHVPDNVMRFWEHYLAGKKLEERVIELRDRTSIWRAVHDTFMVFGYRGIYPHMLRHAIAIMLAGLGVPLNVLQRFLRHTDPKNTAIYYSISARDMHPYMENVKRKLLMRDGIIL